MSGKEEKEIISIAKSNGLKKPTSKTLASVVMMDQAVPLFEQLLDDCVGEVCCKSVDVHGEGLALGDPVHLFEKAAEFTVD